MHYPTKLKVSVLQSENAEYSETKPHVKRIALLAEGGYKLRDNLGLFLKQRQDESADIYRQRLDKYTYSNVLGAAISELSSKFSNGNVYLSGITNPIFWQAFRENNNGAGRTERQLLAELFGKCLPYRQTWVHVDKPKAPYAPRSAAEEASLGLEPRLIVYNAQQVLSWDETDNGTLKWAKIFQIIEDISPIEKPIKKAVWTFVDDECVCSYSLPVEVKNGEICNILNSKGDRIDRYHGLYMVEQESVTMHGFGCVPIVRVALPYSQWGGNQAYPKAEEALRLETHRYDLLTNAYWQRFYKRAVVPEDLGSVFADTTDSIPVGMQFVPEADNFAWSEPTGAIIEPLTITLEKAASEIRNVLSMGGAAYASTASAAPIEASGLSKEMDFVNEDERLKSYGHIFTDALQDIYQLVAKAKGFDNYANIAVSGLDDFGRDRMASFVEALTAFVAIDLPQLSALMPPTLFAIVREKLISYLMGNLTPEQRSVINNELAAMPTTVDPIAIGATMPAS
ncbi:MAG: hypothetical protein U5M23_00385 [Marinagarivorans sp.]|nr:hypothetical protein [Marinagarivorans sp.]